MPKWVGQDHVFSETRGNPDEGDTIKGIKVENQLSLDKNITITHVHD